MRVIYKNIILIFTELIPVIYFFKKLFNQQSNKSIFKNCVLCGDFITTSNYKKADDFVKHYEEGKGELIEDKPIDIINTLNIRKYQIS